MVAAAAKMARQTTPNLLTASVKTTFGLDPRPSLGMDLVLVVLLAALIVARPSFPVVTATANVPVQVAVALATANVARLGLADHRAMALADPVPD